MYKRGDIMKYLFQMTREEVLKLPDDEFDKISKMTDEVQESAFKKLLQKNNSKS